MTKEYTGPEEFTCEQFEIEFARAWLKYVEGGKVGVDPRTQWEHKSGGVWRWSDHPIAQHPGFVEGVLYRWKPAPKRIVTIGYKNNEDVLDCRELVAPEVEAPAMGTVYYCQTTDLHPRCVWDGAEYDTIRLDKGLVFLAREDAQAMSDWLATCRKGGQ